METGPLKGNTSYHAHGVAEQYKQYKQLIQCISETDSSITENDLYLTQAQ